MKVGVVIAVHGEAPFLDGTLTSIEAQSRKPDHLVAVLDSPSTDVVAVLRDHGFETVRSTSTQSDSFSRIAQNFHQGLRALDGCEIAVLGDHDDVWESDRVQLHTEVMCSGDWWMTAGDGECIDSAGNPLGASLRESFPAPGNWNAMSVTAQMRWAARHSVVTGGASAVRIAPFADKPIPTGWLHDRWWSLVATKHHALHLDDQAVIDYRIASDQQVGLDTAGQDRPWLWAARKASSLGPSLLKARDVLRYA